MSDQTEKTQEGEVVEFAPLAFPPVEYGVTDAALAELAERYKEPDASTDDGHEYCKSGCRELSTLRNQVETRRLDLKRPITEWIRTKIDGRGKDLIRRIRIIEAPVRAEKERIDEIKQAEARKAAEVEQQRLDGIRENIAKIVGTAAEQHPDDTASDYETHTTWLTELQITEEIFGEFVDEASTARDAALFKLTQWRDQALKREQDDAKRKREQDEIDRQKKELYEREAEQRKEREQLEKEQREADERKAADEKEAQEKDEREQRDRDDAEERQKTERTSAIGKIRQLVTTADGLSSDAIETMRDRMTEPTEAHFEGFFSKARETFEETKTTLTNMAKDARESEEKQRRDDEARLPDKEKLTRWCDAIASITEPEVLNDKAQKILKRYGGDLSKLTDRLRSDIGKL